MPWSAHAIRAVILDWAGTTVDCGSRAPARVFVEIFHRRGIDIAVAEARGPMGMAKRDHIAAVARMPRVASLWRERYARDPSDADVRAMYEEFLPLQKDVLARGSGIIPGVPEAVAELRRMGLKIGTTTGYARELMEVVAPIAARGGYVPDVIVTPDDASAGRPAPWMNFRAAEALGVYPMNSVVVVDDTAVGIQAGLNAGAWTVAVALTGNALGISHEEMQALPAADLESRFAAIEHDFRAAGAHAVIRSLADLPALIARLSRPGSAK